MNLELIVLAVFSIWLLILTYFYISAVRHYKKLSIGKGENLEKVMNTVFRGLEQLYAEISDTKEIVEKIEKNNIKHIQKFAIKRYNPFGDTGGDQSFTATFLNAKNDGIVFSSLHGRSGTRIYAKAVKSGLQHEHELSSEERDVINLALQEKKDE